MLDRGKKNIKNDFKYLFFLIYIFQSVFINCIEFHENRVVISWDIQEIGKHGKNRNRNFFQTNYSHFGHNCAISPQVWRVEKTAHTKT
jgi:hypothetical protein